MSNYMVHSTDIIAYAYNADIYCVDDIVSAIDGQAAVAGIQDVEAKLDYIARMLGFDRYNESSFDSGDFPKVCFANDDDTLNSSCGACHQRISDTL